MEPNTLLQQIQQYQHLLQPTNVEPSGYLSLVELAGQMFVIDAENWEDFVKENKYCPYWRAWKVRNLSSVTRFMRSILTTIDQQLDHGCTWNEVDHAIDFLEQTALQPLIIKEISFEELHKKN